MNVRRTLVKEVNTEPTAPTCSAEAEAAPKSKPRKGKLKKWFHDNPTYVALILCVTVTALVAM